jgi:prepilin-type N-terminal cleavage/methylation domain-containing protein
VNKGRTKSIEASRTANRERGFSIVELLVAVAVIMILAAMAVFQLRGARQAANSDAAMRELVSQLRQAREYAIANRRYVQITFPVTAAGQPQIRITQKNSLTTNAGADVVLSTVMLESPLVYTVDGMPDLPAPETNGNASAIEFEHINGGPPAGMYFQSDGELVDGGTFLPISGTVFLGVAGIGSSARAVSVLGTTGRIRGWRSTGTGWTQF